MSGIRIHQSREDCWVRRILRHLYLTYRSRALYIPHEHAEQARQAQAAWKEFWDVACALAAENHEHLRERMQGQEHAARRRSANG